VPVSDKGRATREQALTEAFRNMLVQVSGYSGVLEDPAVTEALDSVDRYVRQFRYRTREPGPESPEPLGFWVQFDSTGVEQLLRRHDLPVWSSARPVMLVWLAVEENGKRRLVGAGDTHYAPLLKAQSAIRGLPLRLPLLDLTDKTQLRPGDVWGDFRGAILAASERYEAQAVLAGRLYRRPSGKWQVRWALYQGGEAVHWENGGPDLKEVLGAGIDASADTISLRYTRAYGERSESTITLRVQDIANLEDYSRALRYLGSVSGVEQVRVMEMGPDYTLFRLWLDGSSNSVIQALALGDALVAEPGSAEQEETGPNSAERKTGLGTQHVYRLLK